MRHLRSHVLFLLALFLALTALAVYGSQAAGTPPAQGESITLYPDADAFITNRYPNSNFGDDHYLEFWYEEDAEGQYGAFMLFRFELQEALGPEVVIDSATLQLYMGEASGTQNVRAKLHPILEAWREDEVSWNNQPNVLISKFLMGVTFDSEPGWKEIDLTPYADEWLAGDNFGIELRAIEAEFRRIFESSEHNERMPRLVVRYHLPQPTPTYTATATKTPTATVPSGQAVQLMLCATADATVDEGHAASNYGAAEALRVGYGQGENEPFATRALVRFDLSFIPPGSEILEARFEAGQVGAGGEPLVPLALYAVRGSWAENSVTWNNQPPVSGQAAATIAVDDGRPTVISWEVRALVREWASGGLDNQGLLLRGPESGATWLRVFESRHHTPFCPRLVLDVIPNGPMPSPTPSPTPTATATSAPVCPQADAAGDSFSQAAPLAPFQDREEVLCPSGDRDYWKFPIEPGQEIRLSLWGMEGDYDLALFDPGGALVAESARWGAGSNEAIYHIAYQKGEYRALVKGKGVADWHPTKAYKLRADTPFKCFEADEAGNSFATAKFILPSLPQGGVDRALRAALCPEGDIDFFQFYVPGGQQVEMGIELSDLPADYDLTLHDPQQKVAATSTNSGTAAELITHTALNQPGYWRVSVSGKQRMDGTWPYHAGTYKLAASLSSQADYRIKGIEVTQAIQDLANSVTLAEGKLTMARVYLDGGSAPGPLSGVEVTLQAWRSDWGATTPLPGALSRMATNLALKDVQQSRLDSTASVNFFLPAGWISEGKILLRADVNPGQSVPETSFKNNSESAGVRFRSAQAINLGIVPVSAGGLVLNPITDPGVADMIAWTRQAYPTSQIQVWYPTNGPITANYNYNFPNPYNGTCGDGWSALLSDLEDVYDDWPNRPGNAIVFGVLHPSVPPTGPSGCGRLEDGISAGIMGANMGPVLAHEMGHNYHRHHAPECVPAGGTLDNGYPQYVDPQGTPYPRASIGEVGINTNDMTIFDPQNNRDIMSYCPDRWISPYTWSAILSNIPRAAAWETSAGAAAEEAPAITVSGFIEGGEVTLYPFWVQDRPAGSADGAGEGPYSIRLLDGQGRTLRERRLEIRERSAVGDHAGGTFHEWLRYEPETAAIALYQEGRLLGKRPVSAHAPQVALLAPNGGESWTGSGPYSVRWQASDADGDPLTAKVYYSADDGRTWQPLTANISGSQVALDTSMLPGSSRARVKVLVTDGVNTAADESDGAFQVENKPPLIILLSPREGTRHVAGEPLVLQALATDPEDGPLPASALSWTLPGTARDAVTGSDVVLEDVDAGEHVLEVRARDEGGLVSSRAVQVRVGWHMLLPVVSSHSRAATR